MWIPDHMVQAVLIYMYIHFYALLGYHVELHARPNLLTLQCSVFVWKDLKFIAMLLLIHSRDGVIHQPLEYRDSVATSGHPVKTGVAYRCALYSLYLKFKHLTVWKMQVSSMHIHVIISLYGYLITPLPY